MDGLMGSVEGKVSLALFGLLLAGGTVTFRWWQIQRTTAATVEKPVMLYVPTRRANILQSPLSPGEINRELNTTPEEDRED